MKKIVIKVPSGRNKHYLLAADKVQLQLNSLSGWQFILFPLDGSKVDHWVTEFTDEEAKKVCAYLKEEFGVNALCTDCQSLTAEDIKQLLKLE